MASTSVTLGPHWDEFIALMLKEGRYGSTSELIRASLRLMEEQEGQRARLRVALMEGKQSGDAGPLDLIHVKRTGVTGLAAKSDLVDIWVETDRQWGEAQADRYLDDIDRALKGLIANPQMGSDCSDLLQGARKLITGRHLVFYEVDPDRIFVIRVLHQSMDVPRHLRSS